MYRNFIVVAWRSFLRNKGYSSINIFGLAIALSACLLIMLYVRHELSFDQFHEHADRIYRVNNEIKFGDNHLDLALAPAPFGATAKSEIPQVEAFTRLQWHASMLIRKGEENVRQEQIAFADSTLFDVFTLPVISGTSRSALNEPNTIVLTESVAVKYFGSTDVAGKTVLIDNNSTRKITAVIKDLPSNSHFRFTCFVPLMELKAAGDNNWTGSSNFSTYLLVAPGTDRTRLTELLNQMMERHLGPELKTIINKTLSEFKQQGNYFVASITPLTDIHLHSHRVDELYGSGRIEYVYLFSAVALFILVIAIINFMNLSTARSAGRAREVGVRKVLGSLRSSLVQQFMLESLLTCALATIMAMAFTTVILPQFNSLIGKDLDYHVLYTPGMLTVLLLLVAGVGLLSGTYPAFYLSAFQPASVLKAGKGGFNRTSVRNVLVVFQFAASVMLIAGTLVIYLQMDFIRKRDLGFNRGQLIVINNVDQIGNRVDALRNSLLELSGVGQATVSGFLPVGYLRSNNTFFLNPTLDIGGAISMQAWTVDDQYVGTMGMRMAEGRDFSREIASDSTAVILNQSAVRFLGGGNMIGKELYVPNEKQSGVTALHVVGVVNDFNYSSLREEVKPLAFVYGKFQANITLRLNAGDMAALMTNIERKWKAFVPDVPFEFSFMDEDYNRFYADDQQVGDLFTVFASLSIFISCLGLLGLATYMAEQRSKEIGIRKVLGASVTNITSLLSFDFLRLVLLAIAIAIPLSWWGIRHWLQSFAYHVDVSWWVFPCAGLVAIAIACLTVSYQSIRAAVSNPVHSLRME